MTDPRRAIQAQTALNTKFVEIWGNAFRRMTGENIGPVIPYDPRDKRFADPQWKESPIFDFLRQAYTMTVDWASELVARQEGLDD
ncbi:class I poly(R)-hydroxyalkanoic acid synthase, partial [Citrobacter sp. AAK_AS5]